jgi:hypothetical protein
MILGAEIGLAIMGLLALIRGRMTVSKTKVVVGWPARLLGLLALTPLPLVLLIGIIYVAANVDATDQAAAERFAQEHKGTITLIEGVTVAAIAFAVIGLAAAAGAHPDEVDRRTRPRAEEYDDYEDDDRPRRRRRDQLEDDERPRRVRRDDDGDDRPRRRRDDD